MDIQVQNNVDDLLKGLSWDNMSKVLTDAIKMTQRELKQATKSQFQGLPIKTNSKKFPSSVASTSFWKDDTNGTVTGSVSILRKGRLLKIFEKGTNGNRTTRSGQNRGSIQPYRFFRKANDSYNTEKMFMNHLKDQVEVLKYKLGSK